MSESSGRHPSEPDELSPIGDPDAVLSMERYLHPDTLLVEVGDRLLAFRGLAEFGWMPRCVARTKRGRCRNSIEHPGGVNGWNEYAVEGKFVEALDPGAAPDEAFIRQRCSIHLNSDVSDIVAPDWEKFDPVKHRRLLRGHSAPAWSPEGLPRPRPISRTVTATHGGDRDAESLDDLIEAALENRVEPPALTALYRYFDDQDRLLYVGITDNLFTRTASHAESSSWMDFAVRSTIERHPTRKGAEKAEREAIKAECPLFNHQHNDTPEARRRLVEYLIEHGRIDLLAADVSRG